MAQRQGWPAGAPGVQCALFLYSRRQVSGAAPTQPSLTLHDYLRHLNLESPFNTLLLDPLLALAVFLKLLVNINGLRS